MCSGQVQINSPKIVDGIFKPYLVLETKNMNATVTMETWLFTASAKLGVMELLDYWNKGNMNNQLQSQYQYYPWSHKLVLSADTQVLKLLSLSPLIVEVKCLIQKCMFLLSLLVCSLFRSC